MKLLSGIQSALIKMSYWRWGPFAYLHLICTRREEAKPASERLKAKLAYKLEGLNDDHGEILSK